MKDKEKKTFLFLLIVVIFCVACLMYAIANRNRVGIRELPRIDIALNDVKLGELFSNKDMVATGSGVVFDNNGKKGVYDTVEIKGRGNSTWVQEKKPFTMKFRKKVDLLGLGESKKWVLLANYFDSSHLRNDLGFKLEQMLVGGEERRGEFVELYINNEYLGLYYLTRKIDIGKDFINLKDSLGIIVEMENLRREEEVCYDSSEWSCLTVKDVVSKDNKDEAMNDFLGSFNGLEKAAKEGDFNEVERIADVDSLARYYLVSEFSVNPDAYTSSYYWYKDGKNDKIHVGPVWDFDLAFGNKRWMWNVVADFHSPDITRAREPEAFGEEYIGAREKVDVANSAISKVIYYLMRIPEFRTKVDGLFSEYLAGREQELLDWLDSRAMKIYFAAQRNKERWGSEEFGDSILELRKWIMARYDYMEEEYGE